MPAVMNDSRSDILPIRQDNSIAKPQPVLVDAPLARRTAESGVVMGDLRIQETRGNFESAKATIRELSQESINRLSTLSPLVSEKLQMMQAKEFQDGYMRALAGESVADIAKSNKFRIFGDGAAVRGAQLRQQESAGTSIMNWVRQNEGDLTRMTGEQRNEAISQYLESLSTGDSTADVMIGAGAMKLMPTVIDNLTKTAEIENQKQAAVQQADTIMQYAQTLKEAGTMYSRGTLSEGRFTEVKGLFLESLKPLSGQTDAAYRESMKSTYYNLLKEGMFDTADLVGTKVLDPQLTPDEKLDMYVKGQQFKNIWLMDNPESQDYMMFKETISSHIQAGRYSSTQQLLSAIDSMNETYKGDTLGVHPLIDNKERARLVNMFNNYATGEYKARQAAVGREQEFLLKQNMYNKGLVTGDVILMNNSGLDGTNKSAANQQLVDTLFNGNNRQKLQASNAIHRLADQGYIVPELKQEIDNTMGLIDAGLHPTPEAMGRLQVMMSAFSDKTVNDKAITTAYFGDRADTLNMMRSVDLTDPKSIAQLSKKRVRDVEFSQTKLPQDLNNKVDKMYADMQPWSLTRWVKGLPDKSTLVKEREKESLRVHVREAMKDAPNAPDDVLLELAKMKYEASQSHIGGFSISGDKDGNVTRTLVQGLDVNPYDRGSTVFGDAMKYTLKKKMGSTFNDVDVVGVSVVGTGLLSVDYMLPTGTTETIWLHPEDIVSDWASRAEKGTSDLAKQKAAVSAYKKTRVY